MNQLDDTPQMAVDRDYIEQWRTYLHALNSPRLRPTPILTRVQSIDPDELEETKALLIYESRLTKR